MGDLVADDRTIILNLQVRSLMGGQLKDNEGEAQLEDDLQSDQAAERVVVALLGWGKKMSDKGYCNQPSCAGPSPGHDRIKDRPVDSNCQPYPIRSGVDSERGWIGRLVPRLGHHERSISSTKSGRRIFLSEAIRVSLRSNSFSAAL